MAILSEGVKTDEKNKNPARQRCAGLQSLLNVIIKNLNCYILRYQNWQIKLK